ncbi:MAG TPA: choice-of-anchor D domain-containing protein [Solirubrobacterales bacterium]|nr:choice-of-anchor D domain-containing protein [Solirubrobacterales bacterium]
MILVFVLLATSICALPGAASALKFESAADSPLIGPLNPATVTSGDLNGDGTDDLVVSSQGYDGSHPSLNVWLSDGDGTFTAVAAPPLFANRIVSGLQMGQLNPETDSDLDLIAFTDYGSEFNILFGDGDGTFTDTGDTNMTTTPYSGGPNVQLGDLNGDGVLDLAVAGYPDKISAAINDGEGSFTVGPQQTVAGATELDSLAIGDFDGDGKGDLAMSNFGGANQAKWGVFAMRGNGDGTFADVAGSPFPMLAGNFGRSVATMDLNGDARDDLAVSTQPGSDPSEKQVQTLLGDATTFFAANPAGTVPAGDTPFNVFAGDIDGDGFDDDAGSANFGGESVSIGLGDQAGGLTVPLGSPVSLGIPAPGKRYFPWRTAIGDFNDDGGPDLAVGSNASGTEVLKSVVVLLAEPDLRPVSEEIQFGDWTVGSDAPAEGAVVRNEGSAPGGVESATISGPDAGQFDVTQPGAGCDVLAYGQECTLQVSFDPTSLGSKNATLSITTGESEDPIEITLTGSGIPDPAAAMEVSPGAVKFPETKVGDGSAAREVTITSTGNIPLQLNGSGLSGSDAGDFTLDPLACETAVRPGESCVMTIAFKPGSAGAKTASVRLTGNIPETMVQLSGTAISPPPPSPKANLSLKAPKKVRRGKKLKVAATVTNTGTSALTGVVLTAKVPGKLAKAPRKITIASIPAGKSVKKTIKVAVKKKAKKGKKLTVQVTATAAGKKLSSKKAVTRIR